ncbi:UNVERIFIED_CONTAM: hypothetical protein PYX00_008385 [Menopon gallinae]|uniref:Uncharacterized protein n=1 Tax=Menopon gallinae TaxID=328185 RepID=A0AAW2HN28_9NEOP
MSLEPGIEKGIQCPAPISRLRVEKIEGGLVVAGVVVAANCQVALPVFGFLFILVGIVLTVASYRGPGKDEAPENYEARIAFTGNSRILGPACIVVGLIMLAAGVGLCLLTRKARRRERRVGFHCPVHGDFYPLSPVSGPKKLGALESKWGSWFTRSKHVNIDSTPPQCPHTQFSSTRSSFSSNPPSPCPTPMPFLVTSGSISGLVNSIGVNLSPDQTFGSIRSLSVSREVASFPMSRTPSPPPAEGSPSPGSSVAEENKETSPDKEVGEKNNNCTVSVHNSNNQNCINNNSSSSNDNSAAITTYSPPKPTINSSNSSSSNNNNNNSDNNINSVINENVTVTTSGSRVNVLSAQSSPEGDTQQRDSIAQTTKVPRKSVSILLPDEENG